MNYSEMNTYLATSTLYDLRDITNISRAIHAGMSLDALSKGQLCSKLWLANELLTITSDLQTFEICGGWHGTLSFILSKYYKSANFISIDIDDHCTSISSILNEDLCTVNKFTAICANMLDYNYRAECVINTSSEHIDNIPKWLSNVPKNTVVALQNNNAYGIDGHVNCSDSLDDFISKVQDEFTTLSFTGELKTPMYDRYMVIGVK